MRSFKFLVLAGAVALMAALGVSFFRSGHGRQYYDKWQQSAKGYAFSVHHFRPDAGDPTYRTNYAIYYPSTPQYVYYFNPAKGTYWGRFDVKTKGYSLLAEKDRAGRLKDIPERAFPAERSLPNIPDAKDKVQLAEPPDLPAGETPVVAAKTGKGEAGADAAAVPADDALATTPADDKTPPVDPKADKPGGPATPAGPAAPAGAGGTVAQAPPAGGPVVDAKPGVGVVPPTEPVSRPSGVAPVTGGAPAPVGGVVTGGASKVEPSGFPFHPGCHRHSCR
jgi:hypothetical protein